MKKVDKLIISSFIGPFILTFFVVVFILLLVNMIKYFDDIIGKDLGWDVLGTLLFYFAVSVTPQALPLGILLSALITYGNLGEHFELTAVKSLGISMTRSLLPIFIFTLGITFFAYLSNNYMVPKAALETYSLLYDIKQKKPALDLREGEFYAGIPDISIKVAKRYKDGITLKNVIIYDHRGKNGNKDVTVADSGRMFTILNDQYLKLELFRGYNYSEGASQDMSGQFNNSDTFSKTKFEKTEVVFDLSSFGLYRTEKKWFASNRIMRNMKELVTDMDSVNREIYSQRINIYNLQYNSFFYHFKKDSVPLVRELKVFKRKRDSTLVARMKKDTSKKANIIHSPMPPSMGVIQPLVTKVIIPQHLSSRTIKYSDSLYQLPLESNQITSALNRVRMVKSQIQSYNTNVESYRYEYRVFDIQWHKILANSIACIAMFLIGAPLGAIIKKGGLGVPVIASIFFFIIFYVLSLMGEKWARSETTSMLFGMWMPNVVLFTIGLIFLRQARADARLFDADFYNVVFDKAKQWLYSLTKPKSV
ncbi:MAG: Lipopolysaccharide export system permease protein LptF [Cytophagales bacterium]|jgi:lipopolysaccharide export system permease protein|nr:LptF/LptG family permease [Bacteroidota bacterium]MBS1981671.1 LptF/LptG family permease [Bacteroidota bacterium]WHZ08981.1 MAG: Lipopolysaccharide export system permease protein LptF [Cytophagales bacterium]